MLTASLLGVAFGLAIPVAAAVLYIAIDAIARAGRSDGTATIFRGLVWAAGRFAFGAATVEAWSVAGGDRRRAARVRKLLKSK